MRSYLLLLLLMIAANCFAQQAVPEITAIKNLSPDGVLLNKGWKFQKGDSAVYSLSNYNDSNWQSIDPTLDVMDMPLFKPGIYWLRIHLMIDSNTLKEQLAMVIEQSGASEIYLDGILIKGLGTIDSDVSKIKAFDPLGKPVGLPVKHEGKQVLAVRYSLQQNVTYKNIFGSHNYIFKTSIYTVEGALNSFTRRNYVPNLGLPLIGIFLILTLIHFSFYLFYKAQKANLYFSLFTLLTTIGFIGNYSSFKVNWVYFKPFAFLPSAMFITTGYLFMVIALYALLEQKKGKWYYILVTMVMLCQLFFFLPGYWGWQSVALVVSNLVNLEITRISFLGVREKKRGAWIMAVGSAGYLVFWACFSFLGKPGELEAFSLIVFDMAFLSIPIATSVFLGADFAYTNNLLRQKLIEVEKLSQKTIEQEKEKQQLLANQNEMLEKQVEERTGELKKSLENLKSTQAQLIQSEKMASLGELTAGIAHEIQNPLNFVNNFSEVSNELIDEMKMELDKGDVTEAKLIADDIRQNLEKINHHGKRADAIVKGMLQHSRSSSGQKELTDINALCDEYLRLSYHGLRAKDKSFNAKFETRFDDTIGKINIVPQEMGRVILNLINNAFYAVKEKAQAAVLAPPAVAYEPTVSVITKNLKDKIEIQVKDNGNGIPAAIKEKIFQPFFTTKPTGQGTGLGLSLSYDIVTKGHGGEIKVTSQELQGTTFTIVLPVQHAV